MDQQIVDFFFSLRTDIGLQLFSFITSFASPIESISLMILSFYLIGYQKNKKRILVGALGFLGVEAITAILKVLVHRARPDVLMQAIHETSFSFPSGHATSAAFVFGYFGYMLLKKYPHQTKRVWVIFFVTLAVVLIDVSRLYLGVHYLSDVLVGNLIGLLGLFVTIRVGERLDTRKT